MYNLLLHNHPFLLVRPTSFHYSPITTLPQVPEGLLRCKSLLVLNLSHNQLEVIPSQLLMTTTDLLHLDLANNELDALPPQLRRLANLQTLILSNNPLSHFQVDPDPGSLTLTVSRSGRCPP